MKNKRLPLLGGIVLLVAIAFVGVVSATPAGCTPGYWKNHLDSWPSGINPESPVIYGNFDFDGDGADTNLEALAYPGGKDVAGAQRILLRAAIAAKLNSLTFTGPGGYWFPDGFDDAVNFALGTNRANILALATKLDGWNNAGCPLN